MEKDNGCLTSALILIAAIMLIIFEGLLFTILWGWFIVPLGVTDINVAHGIGLITMLSLFRVNLSHEKKDNKNLAIQLGSALIVMLIFMLIAFIAHLCM